MVSITKGVIIETDIDELYNACLNRFPYKGMDKDRFIDSFFSILPEIIRIVNKIIEFATEDDLYPFTEEDRLRIIRELAFRVSIVCETAETHAIETSLL